MGKISFSDHKSGRTNGLIHTHGHINKSHVQRAQAKFKLLTAVLSQSLAQGLGHTNTQTNTSALGDIIYTTVTKSLLLRTTIPSCKVLQHPHECSNYSVLTSKSSIHRTILQQLASEESINLQLSVSPQSALPLTSYLSSISSKQTRSI